MNRYARLNLKFNPFGELTREQRRQVAVAELTNVLDWLSEPRRAVQFVGPCGHGKSSHLHALARQRKDSLYVRADRESGPVADTPLLLMDEADASWPWTRWARYRRAQQLALALHRPRTTELRAFGFDVLTIHVASAAPDRLRRIFDARSELARRQPGPVPRVPAAVVRQLVDLHGANVRAMEHQLYDAVERLEEVGDVSL